MRAIREFFNEPEATHCQAPGSRLEFPSSDRQERVTPTMRSLSIMKCLFSPKKLASTTAAAQKSFTASRWLRLGSNKLK
jgi:hypothetical protein